MKHPKLSIIIVNYKVKKELFNCIRSIIKSKPKVSYEIIVVDNDEKKTIENSLKKRFKNVRYIGNPVNSGFGTGNNLGTKNARGEYLFFLNPDTLVERNAIDNLIRSIKNDKKTGVASPLLLDKNRGVYPLQGTLELTPVRAIFGLSFINKIFPNNPISKKYWQKNWDKSKDKNVDVVPGTALMIKKDLFERVSGFDEKFFLYFEEFDLCNRIKDLGFEIKIIASSKVVHLWERSTKKREDIKKIFARSKFYYFKKNYGFLNALAVSFLTETTKEKFLLFFIFILGVFLRFYKLDQLMIFIADQGWFYLSARDLLVNHSIPLLGVPSSVVWLKQGPLGTYLIALSLYFGKFHPISPAVFFSALDSLTILLIFYISKKWINERSALFASAFYATSPLILVMSRMPYHTSAIPFFACLFFIILGSKKNYLNLFFLFFILGLLIQLELSNSVLLVLLLIYILFKKIKISKAKVYLSTFGLIIGLLPFIIYDFSHRFIQTVGLPLWIINRVRLFLGLTISGNSTTHNFPIALTTVRDQLAQIIFPFSLTFFYFILILLLVSLFMKRREIIESKIFLIALWFFVPLFGFLIHAAPGMAYFPLIFPAVCLLIGFCLDFYSKFNKPLVILVFLVILFVNVFNIVKSDYFIWTNKSVRMPPNNYGFGPTYLIFNDLSKKIVSDSQKRNFNVKGGGFLSKYESGIDNFKYLILINGGKIDYNSSLKYVIYAKDDVEREKAVSNSKNVLFKSNYFYIYKQVSE
ncbi:MAG: hypothetical protein A2W22_03890 [Candidatus Levybacteria bacterium RBG_16_35_11]|nr:MAG: hypothetical protein A2W22_03890 [Candidatus Levybacteria bacterium RBG_16_35_11]